jgi:hypothetical protein
MEMVAFDLVGPGKSGRGLRALHDAIARIRA